jgi:hypothetical protein
MKRKGKNLEFISWINRDGKGTKRIPSQLLGLLQDEMFYIRRLSLTENTFIAFNFNAYVVKIKPKK